MIKADKYLIETLKELRDSPYRDTHPRAKYADGTLAHAKYITQKQFKYNIADGEFPINTLRTTAIKGGWYDIEAIYIKQTNIIEEMNPAIHSWWKDFVVDSFIDEVDGEIVNSIGQTYGHTVKRYDLVNKLLKGLEENPFGRRHILNLWQEQQMLDDPKALVPCAYMTNWNVREEDWVIHSKKYPESYRMDIIDFGKNTKETVKIRYLDVTLNQRSQDFLTTSSINPIQYVMKAMAVAGHLTFTTGIKHEVGMFVHNVENVHAYERNSWAIEEMLNRKPLEQPTIKLKVNKNFYDYTIDDFEITLPKGIDKLSKPLEIAI